MKNLELSIIAYGLIDTHGHEWAGAAESGCDVLVYGLYDEADQPLHFEGEAHKLERWAKENNLLYGERKQWVNVDVETEQGE